VLPRFFAPEAGLNRAPSARLAPEAGASADDDRVALPEDESAHAARVLRLAVGDSIRVFNGAGGEWRAEITGIAQHRVTVTLRETVRPAAEAEIPIALAVAALKGDKMDDVVRDAVMLGVRSVQPLVTERSEISLAALTRAKRMERWQRVAVSSCKQCGRAVVPRVRPPQLLESFIAGPAHGVRLMLVEPGAAVHAESVHDLLAPTSAEVLVGPEGGWSEGELRAGADRGARLVTLGALTLRADAVPLVALTALRTIWRDL
jgi:16S rRNA (uracil1498-N3)-methyltransferase